jgi:hypothetical protein
VTAAGFGSRLGGAICPDRCGKITDQLLARPGSTLKSLRYSIGALSRIFGISSSPFRTSSCNCQNLHGSLPHCRLPDCWLIRRTPPPYCCSAQWIV